MLIKVIKLTILVLNFLCWMLARPVDPNSLRSGPVFGLSSGSSWFSTSSSRCRLEGLADCCSLALETQEAVFIWHNLTVDLQFFSEAKLGCLFGEGHWFLNNCAKTKHLVVWHFDFWEHVPALQYTFRDTRKTVIFLKVPVIWIWILANACISQYDITSSRRLKAHQS